MANDYGDDTKYPSAKLVYDKLINLSFFPKGTILMYDGTSWNDNVTLKGWYKCEGQTVASYGTLPNLKNRFIIGYDATNTPQRSGGSNSTILTTDNLPSHNHSLTALTLGNEAAHTHSVSADTDTKTHSHTFTGTNQTGEFGSNGMEVRGGNDSAWGVKVSGVFSLSDNTTGAYAHNQGSSAGNLINFSMTPSGTISGDGSHSHSFTATSGAGSGHTHSLSSSTISATGSGTSFDNRPSYYALIYIIKVTNAGE
ncbi:phage tail fiber protein [Candidatus Termititenax persephonae]|uniref:Phage tail fiber protein n=1 Tax=Candidatus Termititenax persephonae TaxID=2218525 RepID=A0A388TI79_9BACT|nr:phage tail fiber protein [Candidatus Termititenax persephonae]